MRLRLLALWENLRGSYWFVPSLLALVSVLAAFACVHLDRAISSSLEKRIGWIYEGGPTGARSVLSTIAGSVITVAGTTFSVTIAALSLASSQFGPRLLRTFRRDTGNQFVLGTFIATFLYCLLVLRTVHGNDQTDKVPGLSVTVGVGMAILSLIVLIYFIHHTAASIQVSHLIDSVSHELECVIRNNLPDSCQLRPDERPGSEQPEHASTEAPRGQTIAAETHGYLLHMDNYTLLDLAKRHKCTIRLRCRPGDFVVEETPLAEISPMIPAVKNFESKLRRCFYFGVDRTPEQDPEFAFLQRAQIGVRALSPGVNDPFTAITCIDRLSAAMALVGRRRLSSCYRYDSQGELRIVTKGVTYRSLSAAAFLYIRRAAAGNREVLQHLLCGIDLALSQAHCQELRNALQEQRSLVANDLGQSPW